MKNFVFCFILGLISAHLSAQVDIEIKLNDIRGGKPPLKFYNADVTLKNTHEKPCWVIFPNYAEDTLPDNGNFEAEKSWKTAYLNGKGYTGKIKNGGPGKMTEIDYLGKYEQSFHAFLIPGKSFLFLKDYSFETDRTPDSIDIAVAESLMINDSVALEKFLPYPVMADKDLSVDIMNTDWTNLNMDRNTYAERSDLPKTEVRFIHALQMKKYRKALKKQ